MLTALLAAVFALTMLHVVQTLASGRAAIEADAFNAASTEAAADAVEALALVDAAVVGKSVVPAFLRRVVGTDDAPRDGDGGHGVGDGGDGDGADGDGDGDGDGGGGTTGEGGDSGRGAMPGQQQHNTTQEKGKKKRGGRRGRTR